MAGLLLGGDPVPFVTVNPAGGSPVVLICEHAGRAVPRRLGDMGVSVADMRRHIACDLGAEGLARCLSDALDAPLILQPYSRLVIDCNRPLSAPDAIPEISDGTPVPANQGLTPADRQDRHDAVHRPFHRAVADVLDRRKDRRMPTTVVTVHSFTPHLAGVARRCHLGVLYNRDARLADAIMAVSAKAGHQFRVVRNAPYSVDDASDYTVPVHGERRGLKHVLLEVRNDLISDATARQRWAALLQRLLTGALQQMTDAA